MTQKSLANLLGGIARLTDAVAEEAERIQNGWSIAAQRASGPSLTNLAVYLALRQQDLSPLQPALAAHGLSTLGRCESHVLQSLHALHASLTKLCGAKGPDYPRAKEMSAGFDSVAEAQRLFFADDVIGASTRIMGQSRQRYVTRHRISVAPCEALRLPMP